MSADDEEKNSVKEAIHRMFSFEENIQEMRKSQFKLNIQMMSSSKSSDLFIRFWIIRNIQSNWEIYYGQDVVKCAHSQSQKNFSRNKAEAWKTLKK